MDRLNYQRVVWRIYLFQVNYWVWTLFRVCTVICDFILFPQPQTCFPNYRNQTFCDQTNNLRINDIQWPEDAKTEENARWKNQESFSPLNIFVELQALDEYCSRHLSNGFSNYPINMLHKAWHVCSNAVPSLYLGINQCLVRSLLHHCCV